MKIFAVTVCHARPDVFRRSFETFFETAGNVKLERYVVVDHHYPINYWDTKLELMMRARRHNMTLISPIKNLGGHGGFNWALSEINPAPDDIIIGYDPDSNPLTPGWAEAMVEFLSKNQDFAHVSLMHEHIAEKKDFWRHEKIGDFNVAFPPHIDMINVTAWNAGFLLRNGGLHGLREFYGFVEIPTSSHVHRDNMRFGYLWDYRETLSPVPHHKLYNEWKGLHAGGTYLKNFNEFVREQEYLGRRIDEV